MKTFGLTILLGGICLFALPLSAFPLSAQPPFAVDGILGVAVLPAAYGDAPMPGRKHGGGGRRHSGTKKDLTPGVPAMNGATREDADKEYKKKYGF